MARPDVQSAARQAGWRVALHPLTWGAYLPAVAVAGLLTVPWWLPAGLGAAATAFVGVWWGRRWPLLRDRARFTAISKWVAQEDAALENDIAGAAAHLERGVLVSLSGSDSAAQGIRLLQTTLQKKRALEACFLADGVLTAEEEEVMETIKGLSVGMRDELLHLGQAERDRAADAAAIATLRRAAHAISQTADALDALATTLAPRSAPAEPPPDQRSRMRLYIEQLDDRAAQAMAVKRRLDEAMQMPTATLDGPLGLPLTQ